MAYFRCTTGGSGKGNTLVVTCADDLAGATITCTNGTKTYTKTCPSTSPYEVTFYGLEAGTWTVSTIVSGDTYTTTVVIADYEAELGGFSWRAWVDLSKNYTSSDFTDLDELLDTELAVRELMSIHACVDYLAGIATESADVETIIGNDLCAKWINNRDYALDTLYANEIIADYMDTADKYFYGEWVITDDTTTPPTWGPKGNVPVMTSDTEPYGQAIASRTQTTSYNANRAFDNNSTTYWMPTNSVPATTDYIGYKFTNPIKPKKVRIERQQYNTTQVVAFEGSNDNSAWEQIGENISLPINVRTTEATVTASKFYLYLRIRYVSQASTSIISISSLQFYGRELKVSVPAMTTNTTPYGEAGGTSVLVNSSGFDYYTAFNNNSGGPDDGWLGSGDVNERVYYKFPQRVCVKLVTFSNRNYSDSNGRIRTFKIQASNDGSNWEDVTQVIDRGASADAANYKTVVDLSNNNVKYQYWAIFGLTTFLHYVGCVLVNFFGLDYSEREFEEGVTKKWLYDHGVELVNLTSDGYTPSETKHEAEKESSQIYLQPYNNTSNTTIIGTDLSIDLTPYNIIRIENGNKAKMDSSNIYYVMVVKATKNASSNLAALVNTNAIATVKSLDISSINQGAFIMLSAGYNNREYSFNELWLE